MLWFCITAKLSYYTTLSLLLVEKTGENMLISYALNITKLNKGKILINGINSENGDFEADSSTNVSKD